MPEEPKLRTVNWRECERSAVDFLVARGWSTIATASLIANNRVTQAPMMIGSKQLTILPDCFALRHRNGLEQLWLEVKGKTQPGWRYTLNRWEHGIDYNKFMQYVNMSEQFPSIQFYVILWEENQPKGNCPELGFSGFGGWLITELAAIRNKPAHRELYWPSKEEAKKTGGGWLWPRKMMYPPPAQQDLFHAF